MMALKYIYYLQSNDIIKMYIIYNQIIPLKYTLFMIKLYN